MMMDHVEVTQYGMTYLKSHNTHMLIFTGLICSGYLGRASLCPRPRNKFSRSEKNAKIFKKLYKLISDN